MTQKQHRICWADTETFCETDIRAGTHRYAEDAEITVWAYAFDDGPVNVWDCTNRRLMPDDLADALDDENTIFVFHNCAFDYTVLWHTGIRLPISRFRCTMAQALAHGLPGSLEKLGEVMGIKDDYKKLKDGRALIQLFCKPRPKNMKLRRATSETHPAEWARFLEYAANDIVAMRAIAKKLPKWNYREGGHELALWHLDQTINARGVLIDLDLARSAITSSDRVKAQLAEETSGMTFGEVGATTQRDALMKHMLDGYGIDMVDLRTSTVETLLDNKDLDLPPVVRELLENRLSASRTSTSKYQALIRATSSDGRLRGTLQFCGASRTGRWAGRIFQPQNLARVPKYLKKQYDDAIDAIKSGSVEIFYDNPMEVLGASVRGALVAAPGKKFCVSDLSNIEGRALAWEAGETWKLTAFREFDAGRGADLYKLAYAKAFDLPVEQVDDGDQRQVGKVMELACFGPDTLVLTDRGYVPIIEVRLTDRVWDGETWTKHKGLLERGAREVVTVAGIKVTPDHLIKTGETWTRAKILGSNESILCQALATGSESLPYSEPRWRSAALCRMEWSGCSALAVLRRIWFMTTTFARGPVRDATYALRSKLATGVRRITSMPMSARTMATAGGYSTAYLPASGVVPVAVKNTRKTTGIGGSGCLNLGERTSALSSRIWSRLKGGITQFLTSTVSTLMATTPPAICDSSADQRTQRTNGMSPTSKQKLPVFDLLYCGPRNAFTILSSDGPLLVHNCGYAGGVGAFLTFAAAYGIDLDDMARRALHTVPKDIHREATRAWDWAVDQDRTYGLSKEAYIVCDSFKRLWRYAHPETVTWWKEVETAAKQAVLQGGVQFEARCVKFIRTKAWLRMVLPSGRSLCYPSPQIDDAGLSYMGVNQFNRKWQRIRTYSGKLVENATQGIARDVLATNMPAMEAEGYPILLTVHDEVICETTDTGAFSADGLSRILSRNPKWARDMPLAAAGFETHRYRKE